MADSCLMASLENCLHEDGGQYALLQEQYCNCCHKSHSPALARRLVREFIQSSKDAIDERPCDDPDVELTADILQQLQGVIDRLSEVLIPLLLCIHSSVQFTCQECLFDTPNAVLLPQICKQEGSVLGPST